MAYYRHLFSLYIHCSSQRCVTQRRVAFRGMLRAERPPVVRVHRSEKVQWSEWQQSQFFIRIALHLCPHHTKHQVSTPYEDRENFFDDKIL